MQCKERYIIRFSSPYFSPNDVASGYVVWYTYPNKKQESVQVELLKTDELIVSESPSKLDVDIKHTCAWLWIVEVVFHIYIHIHISII